MPEPRLGNFSPLSKERELGLIDQEIARRQSPSIPTPSPSRTDHRLALIDQEIAKRKEAAPKVKERGVIGELAAGFGRGALGVVAAPAEIADIAGEAIGWEALEKAGESGAKAIEKYIKESPKLKRTESISKNILKNPELWKDPRWYSSIVGEGLPTILSMFIPGMAAAKAAKVAKLGAKGVRAARIAGGLTAGIGLEAAGAASDVRQYEEQTGEAVPISTKLQSVLGTGIVAGSLEYVPIFAMFGKAGASKLVSRVLTGMATEGTTEGAQELVANAFAKAGYDADQNMVDGVVESIVGGVLLGGGMGAVSRATNFKERVDETNPEEVSEILEQTETEAKIPEEQQAEFTRRREETALRTAEERQAAIEAAAPMTTASDETTTLAEEAVRPEPIVEEIVPEEIVSEEVVPEEIPLVPGEIPAPLRAMGMRPAPAKPAVEKAAVPFMITKETEAGLSELGYTKEDIGKMAPEDALGLVEGGTTKEPVAEEKIVEPKIEIPTLTDTTQAIAFGKKAIPEQITELKRLRKESEARYAELTEEGKLDEAGEEALRAQLYREAFEAKGKPKESKVEKPEVVEKEPWEMSKEEWIENEMRAVSPQDIRFGETRRQLAEGALGIRKNQVKRAIEEGEIVPIEVLKEYPALTPAKPITPKPPKPTPPEAVREEIEAEPIPEVAPKPKKEPRLKTDEEIIEKERFLYKQGLNDISIRMLEEAKRKTDIDYKRTIKTARKVASLENEKLSQEHVAEAIQYAIKDFAIIDQVINSKQEVDDGKTIWRAPNGQDFTDILERVEEVFGVKPKEKVKASLEKVPTKPEPGFAWIKGKQKPILSAREIARGKNKGKYEVTLTKGRDEEGNIIPGAKKIVTEKEIITMPEEKIVAAGKEPWRKDNTAKAVKKEIDAIPSGIFAAIEEIKIFGSYLKDPLKSNDIDIHIRINKEKADTPEAITEYADAIETFFGKEILDKKVDLIIETDEMGMGFERGEGQVLYTKLAKPGEKAKIVKPVIPGVKPKVKEEKIEVVPTPEGKEITVDLTKKEEAAVTPKQQKTYLLAEIDNAIGEAPKVKPFESLVKEFKKKAKYASPKAYTELLEKQARVGAERIDKYGTVTIHVPDDGVFTILNTKQSLEEFKKKAKNFPAVEPKAKKVIVPGVVRKAPAVEKIDELRLTPSGSGYFTDGSVIIKGKPPASAKYGKKEIPHESIKEILAHETKPTELKYYTFMDPDFGEAVSKTPIPQGLATQDYSPMAVFQSKSGILYGYNQFRLNAITKRFPKAKYGIAEMGLLIAYENKKPVAALMPIGTKGENALMENMAVEKGFIKARPIEKPVEEAKANIKASTTEILKGERGSFSTKTKEGAATFEDFSIVGKDFIKRGADTFTKFTEQMKKTFGEVWESVKHLAKELYESAKRALRNERGLIGGIEAVGSPTGALLKAKDMLAVGKAKEEVWKETGWLQGIEGKWRFEIDDSGAMVDYVAEEGNKAFALQVRLSEILTHPELFKAYPDLKNLSVSLRVESGLETSGRFVSERFQYPERAGSRSAIEIETSTKPKMEEALLHELQHVVQSIEGFARGASPYRLSSSETRWFFDGKPEDEFSWAFAMEIQRESKKVKVSVPGQEREVRFSKEKILELKDRWNKIVSGLEKKIPKLKRESTIEEEKRRLIMFKKALSEISRKSTWTVRTENSKLDRYLRTAGEIEAREVAIRAKLTPKQRREQIPYKAEGIPEEQWIITKGEGTSFSVEEIKPPVVKEIKKLTPAEKAAEAFKVLGIKPKLKPKKPLPTFKETTEPIIEKDYIANRKIKKDVSALTAMGIKRVKSEVTEGIDKFFGAISTRLGNVSPKLKAKVRKLDFDTNTKYATDVKTIEPLLRKAKKMNRDDFADWDYARKNSDVTKIYELVNKYGMQKEYESYRKKLDSVRKEAMDVGLEIGEIQEYAPRILKDTKGFLTAIGKAPEWPLYSRKIQERAQELDIPVSKMPADMRADIISNIILGGYTGLSGVPATKERRLRKIPASLNRYYMDSDAALMQHLFSMRKLVEARKFFGKIPEKVAEIRKRLHNAQTTGNTKLEKEYTAYLAKYALQRDYTENIGAYIDDLIIKKEIIPEQERIVNEILTARFHEKGTRGLIQAYKNISYIDTMGSPISALTQIGDLAWSMYEGGVIRTLKHAYKAARGKSRITKEDVGVERIAQEFADAGTLGSAVSKVFKMVGLEKIDTIGKEALLNTALDKYQKQAKTDPSKLRKEIESIFENETNSVIDDLINNKISENVKLLVYSRLLDFQPVGLSEMPQKYLDAGNGRLFYMLKTFTLKVFDVFRNESYNKIKTGDRTEKIEGMKNLARLSMFFVLANAGADELKDLILGRETDIEDRVVDNILRLFGVSKFVTWKARTEGVGSALARQILPPFKFVDSASKDIITLGDEKGLETVGSIPVIGKLAYWHIGRGTTKREELLSKRLRKKATKTLMEGIVGKEIERLHDLDLLPHPIMPAKSMTIAGKRFEFNEEQYNMLVTESGQASKKKLDSLVGTKYWGMLSDKEKASRIQKIIKDNRKKARNKIKKEFKVAIPGMVPWKKTKKKKRPSWQETTFGKKAGWQKPMEF